MASGSELQHAVKAAGELGDGIRVVSMPCMDVFNRQSAAYKEDVLPISCRKRIAMEAGVGAYWYQNVGLVERISMSALLISVERFGFSAPGDIVMKELDMTSEDLVKHAKEYMK